MENLEQLIDDLVETAQMVIHYQEICFNPKQADTQANELEKIKLEIVDLFKYAKGEDTAQNTFLYTLNAGKLTSVQSI